MAIYHLSIKTISRSSGRSSVAAAAYRSGTSLLDERTGLRHDYTRKGGVEHSEIILPQSAGAEYSERAVLWNLAETAEKRKNSVTAREYEIALPAELDAAQRRRACQDFGGWLAKRFGVAVDIAIHAPHREGDERNHHAHILTTTREIDADGLGAKTRELDDKKTGAVIEVREKWAELANRHLERAGLAERIDHRSHKDRKIEYAPTFHMGVAATAMERRRIKTDRGRKLAVIKAANLALQLAQAGYQAVARETNQVVDETINILSAAGELLISRNARSALATGVPDPARSSERKRDPEPKKKAHRIRSSTKGRGPSLSKDKGWER